MASIDSMQIYSYGKMEAAVDRYSLGHKTESRRESFKNELTVQYGTKYRDPANTRELMGRLQPLGKAFAKLLSLQFACLVQICLLKMGGITIVSSFGGVWLSTA